MNKAKYVIANNQEKSPYMQIFFCQWRPQQKLHSQINIFSRSLEPCTVDSIYNGFYIVFCQVAPRHLHPKKTREYGSGSRHGSATGFALRWTRESGGVPENICAVCRFTLRENKTSKQGKNISVMTTLRGIGMVMYMTMLIYLVLAE